jgi:Tfp pilus assembly protein PilV
LISTVVIALGLLSLASLQSKLIVSSAENKTREEAKSLCAAKIEQLRDSIIKVTDGYDSIEASAENGIIGVNATYSRSWTVNTFNPNDETLSSENREGPARKQIQVTCTWGDATDNKKVIIQSIIVFQDVGLALFSAIRDEADRFSHIAP